MGKERARKKTSKDFICNSCGNSFENTNYKKVQRFCSLKCYWKSKQLRDLVVTNGYGSKGRKCSWGNKIGKTKEGKMRPDMQGSNHWNWQGGITDDRDHAMNSIEYKTWRKAVFERDEYKCRICGDRNGNGKTVRLEAHHTIWWSEKDYESRYDPDYGMTVCRPCHILGHKLFGFDSKGEEEIYE